MRPNITRLTACSLALSLTATTGSPKTLQGPFAPNSAVVPSELITQQAFQTRDTQFRLEGPLDSNVASQISRTVAEGGVRPSDGESTATGLLRSAHRLQINSKAELDAAYNHVIDWPQTEPQEDFEFDVQMTDIFERLQNEFLRYEKSGNPDTLASELDALARLCGEVEGENFIPWSERVLGKKTEVWEKEDWLDAARQWLSILNRDSLVPKGWFVYLGPRGIFAGHVLRYAVIYVPFINAWRLIVEVDHDSADILPDYSGGALVFEPYLILSRHWMNAKDQDIFKYAVEQSREFPQEHPLESRLAAYSRDTFIEAADRKTRREEWNHTVDDLRLLAVLTETDKDELSTDDYLSILEYSDSTARSQILRLVADEIRTDISRHPAHLEDLLDVVSEAHNVVREFTDSDSPAERDYSLWRLQRIYEGKVGRAVQTELTLQRMPHEIAVRCFLSAMGKLMVAPRPAFGTNLSSDALDEMIRLTPQELDRFFKGQQEEPAQPIEGGSTMHQAVIQEISEMSVPRSHVAYWIEGALERLFLKLGFKPDLYEAMGRQFLSVGGLVIHPTLWRLFNWPAKHKGEIFIGTPQQMLQKAEEWFASPGLTPASIDAGLGAPGHFMKLLQPALRLGRSWQLELYDDANGNSHVRYSKKGFMLDRAS